MITTTTPTLKPQPSSTNQILAQGEGKRTALETLPATPTVCPPLHELSSINSILQQQRGQRLYVQPLHWTSQHLHFLNCVFIQKSSAVSGRTRKRTAGAESLAESVCTAATWLKLGDEPKTQAAEIGRMLYDHGLHKASTPSRFELRFAQRSVKAYLHIDGLFAPSQKAPPALALLNLDTVAKQRDKSIKLSPSNRMNPPVARIQQKKQASIRPAEKLHDPYIAAVLISLAQAQRSSGTHSDVRYTFLPSTWSASDPPIDASQHSLGLKVYVLATIAQSLYLYTTCIPLTFLDRLDQPSRQSVPEIVSIYHRRLPLKSPTKVSSIIATIAESMGMGSLELDGNKHRPPHRRECEHGLAVNHEAEYGVPTPVSQSSGSGISTDDGQPLPDAGSNGARLVITPNSPDILVNPLPLDKFATLPRKALDQFSWLQKLRQNGIGVANTCSPGHSPPTLKARCITTADDIDDGSITEEAAPCMYTRTHMPTTRGKRRRSMDDLQRIETSTGTGCNLLPPSVITFTARSASAKRKFEVDKDEKSEEVDKLRPTKRRIGSAKLHPT